MECGTYTKDGRVVGDGRRLVLLDARVLLDAEVLYIAAAEYNIFVDLVRRSNLLLRAAFASLCAKGSNIFERDCGLFRVDLVQGADVAEPLLAIDCTSE